MSNEILTNLSNYEKLPEKIKNFVKNQKLVSSLPSQSKILIEKFTYQKGDYLCIYTFLGIQTNHTFSFFINKFP